MKIHYNNIFTTINHAINTITSINYLIILNSPTLTLKTMNYLCKHCDIIICADGGANRLFDSSISYIPSYVKGDLDSIRPDVKDYYSSKGSIIIQDNDQDKNDLEKCLMLVNELISNKPTNDLITCPTNDSTDCLNNHQNSKGNYNNISIYILGAFGGRFDQEMSSFDSLYKYVKISANIILMDDTNIVRYIYPNIPNIYLINKTIEGPVCGIIPIYGPIDRITTNGLKWDLHEHKLAFGVLVSTSNEFIGKTIDNMIENELDNSISRILDANIDSSLLQIIEIISSSPAVLTYQIEIPDEL